MRFDLCCEMDLHLLVLRTLEIKRNNLVISPRDSSLAIPYLIEFMIRMFLYFCCNFLNKLLCYVMLCYVMLCYVMLCYVMLCYVMLCYVINCYYYYVKLCYVMLCCVVLCYVMFSEYICYVITLIRDMSDKL